jgi:hypothetical protein
MVEGSTMLTEDIMHPRKETRLMQVSTDRISTSSRSVKFTSNQPTRNLYAAISAYELARYCTNVKIPQATSINGMIQDMGSLVNKYAKGS